MFYSRELLARKASLGQIWLLGTKQSKLDRRKVNKLNVARLCEEILNPPVPMALRMSSILMGGVVILYEKKVTILHRDANRLLVELRNAWKVIKEPTLLPKRQIKAGRKTITLPSIEDTNVGEPDDEETSVGFQQNHFNLQLDQIDDYYVTVDFMADNLAHDQNQADYEDITLPDPYQPNAEIHDQFERFEEGGEETQQNNSLEEHIQIPITPIPSPARGDGPQTAEDVPEQNLEHQCDQQHNLHKAARDKQRQGPVKRKASRKNIIMDEEPIISNSVYQSWLADTSDIRRARRKKGCRNILSTLKIAKLMELPSTVPMVIGTQDQIPYPPELLELWKKSTQPHHDSSSVRTSQPQPSRMEPEATSPDREKNDYPMDYPLKDLHSGVGSSSHSVAKESELQRTGSIKKVTATPTDPSVSLENSGDAQRNAGSSVSGDGVHANILEMNIGSDFSVGSNKNNAASSSRNSPRKLQTVVEEMSSRNSPGKLQTVGEEMYRDTPLDFTVPRRQQKNLTPEQELLVETQRTMEAPQNDLPDKMIENIRNHLKAHFDAPEAPKVESLNNLAAGLDRKKAARLFYSTCVLASQDSLKVEQKEPFGDILISRGAKMS